MIITDRILRVIKQLLEVNVFPCVTNINLINTSTKLTQDKSNKYMYKIYATIIIYLCQNNIGLLI